MSSTLISPAQALELVGEGLRTLPFPHAPEGLYDPARYILQLGGKRIRPSLTLLAANIFDADPARFLQPALAMEVFHNFTLVHDDIMDEAPLRRGADTVHIKWDLPTAILSGDLLLIEAYKLLGQAPAHTLPPVLQMFNRTAVEVCEGQQLDMDFEKQTDVTLAEYIEMVRLKTSVLLGCSLATGALCAGASEADTDALYIFGEQLGIAFQIMDDVLDAFPEGDTFGKKAGGDIERGKKTFLYAKAMESMKAEDRDKLLSHYGKPGAGHVDFVLDFFISNGIKNAATQAMETHFQRSLQALGTVNGPTQVLHQLAQAVYERTF